MLRLDDSIRMCLLFSQTIPWTICELVNNSSNLRSTSIFNGENVKNMRLALEVIQYAASSGCVEGCIWSW
jgi:hypothetical protein